MAGTPDWSMREIDALFDCWSAGYSDKAIAELLVGRSASAVAKKRQEVGACSPRAGHPPSSLRRRCVAMRDTHTASQIAERLGISRNAVIGHWHRDIVAKERAEFLAAA